MRPLSCNTVASELSNIGSCPNVFDELAQDGFRFGRRASATRRVRECEPQTRWGSRRAGGSAQRGERLFVATELAQLKEHAVRFDVTGIGAQ